VISILPASAPAVGSCTVTALGIVVPAPKLRLDVSGAPVASAGRMLMNPAAAGLTTVTLRSTDVAPAGTTACAPSEVGMTPVIWRSCGVGDVNGPARPRLTGSRVSRTRTGVTDTMSDGALDAALTRPTKPPAPSDTATAAPIAAQRERQR
jgi:hypothetical protein